MPLLVGGAAALGVHLDERARERFRTYCEELTRANLRFNLTALRTPDAMMRHLFLDSLTLVRALDPQTASPAQQVTLIDVGSGSGVPGIPLKIVFPNWRLTLVESVQKKAAFLSNLVETLQLADVAVEAERAEITGRRSEYRDRAGICVARAVAAVPALLELCGPLVRPGGLVLLPKSGDLSGELRDAEPAARALGLRPEEAVSLQSEPGRSGPRVILRYRKTSPTPAEYPRRIGLATSRPVGST
ncbi:MAG: 16S rRNA (guanine(527)-N(7))-methyltransferase RsmG [Chloroflexota bacterium]